MLNEELLDKVIRVLSWLLTIFTAGWIVFIAAYIYVWIQSHP